MQKLKDNWPSLVALLVVLGVFVAENRNLLTADQVGQVFAFLGLGGITAARHMDAPAARKSARTEPPKGGA